MFTCCTHSNKVNPSSSSPQWLKLDRRSSVEGLYSMPCGRGGGGACGFICTQYTHPLQVQVYQLPKSTMVLIRYMHALLLHQLPHIMSLGITRDTTTLVLASWNQPIKLGQLKTHNTVWSPQQPVVQQCPGLCT